jgi:hypothetical protein
MDRFREGAHESHHGLAILLSVLPGNTADRTKRNGLKVNRTGENYATGFLRRHKRQSDENAGIEFLRH